MKINHRDSGFTPFTGLVFLIYCFAAGSAIGLAGQPPATQLSPVEQKEYERIQKRLQEQEDLVRGTYFTLGHCADPNEVRTVEKTLYLLLAFTETSQITRIIEAGGVQKSKVADVSR